jgi:hypothetical protein
MTPNDQGTHQLAKSIIDIARASFSARKPITLNLTHHPVSLTYFFPQLL